MIDFMMLQLKIYFQTGIFQNNKQEACRFKYLDKVALPVF